MKEICQLLKPFDYLLTFVAIMISLSPLVITHLAFARTYLGPATAVIKIEGQQVDEFVLDESKGERVEVYHSGPGHYTVVQQVGDQIRVKEDNSPHQIAVNQGWISQPGETVVNLPHQFIIEIRGQPQGDPQDDLILPHG